MVKLFMKLGGHGEIKLNWVAIVTLSIKLDGDIKYKIVWPLVDLSLRAYILTTNLSNSNILY